MVAFSFLKNNLYDHIMFLERVIQVITILTKQDFGRNVNEHCKSQESRLTDNKLQLKFGMLRTCFNSNPTES